MKIYEFIEEFNKTDANKKGEFISKHIVTDYVPYEKKITICENIVENTSYENRDIDGETVKVFKVNSCARYMYYVLWMIKLYTDIEIEFDNGKGLEAFNLLNKEDLIDTVIGTIPEKETNELEQILSMMYDDFLANERDIVSYIDNKIMNLKGLVNLFIEELKESLTPMKIDDAKQALNKRTK